MEEFALSREQRDDIMKAVRTIERQLKEMVPKPQWQTLYVIGTNLTIIQTNLNSLPRNSPN